MFRASLVGQLAFAPYCFVALAGERADVVLNRRIVFSEQAAQRIRAIASRLASGPSFLAEEQFNAAVRWHTNHFDMKQLTYP